MDELDPQEPGPVAQKGRVLMLNQPHSGLELRPELSSDRDRLGGRGLVPLTWPQTLRGQPAFACQVLGFWVA